MSDLEKLLASIRSVKDVSPCITDAVLQFISDSRCTVLHECVTRNNDDALKQLLAAGFNVNAVDKDGKTPLHYAAARTSLNATEMLLNAGANIDPIDKYGNTPAWAALLVAGSDEGLQLFKRLVAANSDLAIKNQAGKSVASMAQSMNVPAILDVVTGTQRS